VSETPGARAEPQPLGLGAVLRYALPAAPTGFATLLTQIYFLKYAAEVLLVSPGTLGWLIGLGWFWDALSHPTIGHWSDRTRSRLGRRRPWMLAGCVPLGVAFVCLWSPPAALTGTGLLLWIGAALFVFYTAFTMVDMTHTALGAELSTDYHERTQIFGVRRFLLGAGSLGTVAAIGAFDNGGGRTAGLVASAAGGALTIAAVLYTVWVLREPPEHQAHGASLLRSLSDVARNPHGRRLLAIALVQQAGIGALVNALPFYSQYAIATGESTWIYIASFMVASMLGVPLWLRVAPRYEKRHLFILAMLAVGLSIALIAFVGEGQVWMAALIAFGGGLGSAGCDALGPSIQADVIDYDELKTGQRKEGAYFAVWAFVAKLAGALAVGSTGLLLDWLGFVPGVEQNESVRFGLRLLTAFAPAALFLLGVVMFLGFRLDAREHARIRAALDERTALAPRPAI
jgi:glycoside/pentoside/hexuronide:cation symporter, GPH family